MWRRNEYLIFQKIIKLEYEFPEKFFPKAKDLVTQLLVGQGAESVYTCQKWSCALGISVGFNNGFLFSCFSLRTLQSGLAVKKWEATTP